MTNHIKLVGATDTPPEGVDREIMVTESFLKAIEDTLRESTDNLEHTYFSSETNLAVTYAKMAVKIAADRKIIEAIKMVREL